MEHLKEIYGSFRRLHIGTQIWMMLIFGPVIFLPLFAMGGALGPWVAILSILGFAPAPYLIWKQRGFSRQLSVAHLFFWPPLLALVAWHFATKGFSGNTADTIYAINAAVLAVSLLFDVREVRRWRGGETAIA